MADLEDDSDEIESAPPLVLAGNSEPIENDIRVKVAGMRLDHYIIGNFQEYSRSLIQKAIESGSVTVNELPTKSSYKVRTGDRLVIRLPGPTHALPIPEDIPLDVLYEDEYLALINKPPDMVVHPAKGNWSGTLVNALAFRFKELSQAGGSYRPGIVHRLDKDTSGVILIAKEERMHRELAALFESRKIFKEYAAITSGVLDRDSDYIEGRIKHHPHDRVKMIVTHDKTDETAKDAVSYYEVVERFRGFSFVRVQPRTGRTHQIRVHLLSIGCPVLADKTYGSRSDFKLSDIVGPLPEGEDRTLMERQALHAWRLRFQHPRTGLWLETEAPPPKDMTETLAMLRTHRREG